MNNFTAKSGELSKRKVKFVAFAAILITALLFVPVSAAFAHSPIFPEENHDPSHAYQINNPAKSWAVYTALDHSDKGDYYKFTVSKGDKIQIGLVVSESPSVSGFLPCFALMIPGSDQKGTLPSYIEIPSGYGTMLVNGKDPGKASYEPFSPGWLFEVAALNTNAPADGTYYIVVFDNSQKTGNYGLPVGYIESFTPAEFIMIPYNVHTVYTWEGQNLFATYLPLILVLVIGGIMLYVRSRRGKAPRGTSKWLAAFAGLAFLGTAAGIVYQMLLTLSITGFTIEAVFTLIFVIIGIVLGVLTLMYAVREKPTLTAGRRVGLIIIGIIALVGWAGLYLGTALAILAALVPSYAATKK
jgi:hypothetical protein